MSPLLLLVRVGVAVSLTVRSILRGDGDTTRAKRWTGPLTSLAYAGPS
jgi:hypothetical protein